MGASTSTPTNTSTTNNEAMDKEITELNGKLTNHVLWMKLRKLFKAERQYELCSILKKYMQPGEVLYFVERMLPLLVKADETAIKSQVEGGGWNDDLQTAHYMTYTSIFKKLLDNADNIAARIDKLLDAPPVLKAGKRVARKKTLQI